MEIILAARLRISLLLDEEQREDVGEKQGSGEKGEGSPAASALSLSRLCSRTIIPVMNVLILFAGILPRVINTVNSQTGSPI